MNDSDTTEDSRILTEKQSASLIQILVFELENQRYGLPLRDVIETVRAVAITPLPQAPSIIEGVINFRGTVVPVLDIRARFHLRPMEIQVQNHFILARAGKRPIALRVDRAAELIRIPREDLQDAQSVVPHSEYISGVARLSDGLVLIHNLETFLSEAESQALSQSLAVSERA